MAVSAATLVATARGGGVADADGVRLELRDGAETLLITCAGLLPDRVIYSLQHSTQAMPVHRCFLADRTNRWYYGGIAGVTETIERTIALVGDIIAGVRPKRVVAMGVSAGGYMALLLGCRLAIDRVVAFAPQSALSAAWRTLHGETRWAHEMRAIQALPGVNLYDIAEELRAGRGADELHCLYAGGIALDREHVSRLAFAPRVHLWPVATADHNIAAVLQKAGSLDRILARGVDFDSAAPAERFAFRQ